MSSALVNPVHQEGAVAVFGTYRPIAVSELLHRLYATMLNARP